MLLRAARAARALPRTVPHAYHSTTSSRAKASAAPASPTPSPAVDPAPTEKRSSAQKPSPRGSLDALHGLSLHAEAHDQRVVIDAVGPNSFTVSGVRVHGSLLLLPHLATFWNVGRTADVCPDAFALVKLHTPRPDMVLLGTGAAVHPVPPELYRFFRELGVRFDVLDTKNACQTFNVLNQEGRLVAAALLPVSLPPPSAPGATRNVSDKAA